MPDFETEIHGSPPPAPSPQKTAYNCATLRSADAGLDRELPDYPSQRPMRAVNPTPSDSAPSQAVTPASATPKTTWAAGLKRLRNVRFSHVQAIVGTLAGTISIAGAVFSVVQFVRPADTGNLVAIVQAAGSHQSVSDATVEVFTSQNALVAMLRPDATGRVTQQLKEGVYVVRVSHPRYAAEERRVQVQPRRTVELRTNLRAGSSSPLERAVNSGVGAIRRAFHF